MSERIESAALESVGRGAGFSAVAVGLVIGCLSDTPFSGLKAGGLVALLVCFVMLLLAARADRTQFAKTEVWRMLSGHERPASDKAQSLIAKARQTALLRYALPFATAAALLFSTELAGEIHLWLYPLT